MASSKAFLQLKAVIAKGKLKHDKVLQSQLMKVVARTLFFGIKHYRRP